MLMRWARMTRNRFTAGLLIAALLAIVLLVARCAPADPARIAATSRAATQERVLARQYREACASALAVDRLKQATFAEALRLRSLPSANLETLAAYSTVRVEQPRVTGRDETLDATTCAGRMVIDIPPGAEVAFSGQRKLAADIDYSAQPAADGTGLVYRLSGATPIIEQLAAFDLAVASYRPDAIDTLPRVVEQEAGLPDLSDLIDREFAPEERAEPIADRVTPSFDCRRAGARVERMICAEPRLAALDREMAALFNEARDRGSRRQRAALEDSRDRFLAYRNRCADEDCVAQAYGDRMDEIVDIAG